MCAPDADPERPPKKRPRLCEVAAPSSVGRVRVRTSAGEVVLSMTPDEGAGLTGAQLKEAVLAAVGRRHQIKLLQGARELKDADLVEDPRPSRAPVVEVTLVTQQVPMFDPDRPAMRQLGTLGAMLRTDDAGYQLEGATRLCDIVSRDMNCLQIQGVIDAGVVPRLLELAAVAAPPVIRECLRVLSHIAGHGTRAQAEVVVSCGAMPVWVRILQECPDEEAVAQATQICGNLVADAARFRDLAIEAGVLEPVLRALRGAEPKSMRSATSALASLCSAQPVPTRLAEPAAPALAKVLGTDDELRQDDEEVLAHACRALSFLCARSEHAGAVCRAGASGSLVQLLRHPLSSVREPALRAVGIMLAHDDRHLQALLDRGLLRALAPLLSEPMANVRWSAARIVSNMFAGSADQVQTLLDTHDAPTLVESLLRLLRTDYLEVLAEAAWALGNAAASGNREQVDALVHLGCCGGMASLLGLTMDHRVQLPILEFFESVLGGDDRHLETLKAALSESRLTQLLDADDGEHVPDEVYTKLHLLLDRLFHK